MQPVVYYNCLWNPELVNDVLPNEPEDVLVFDASIDFCFYPFVEEVGSYEHKLFLYDCNDKGLTMSIPHSANNQGLVIGLKTSDDMQEMGAYL